LLDSGLPSIFARDLHTISDAGLKHLKTCKLWRLGVASNLVTSKGYQMISDTPSIYDLSLVGAKTFTDADLDYLSQHSYNMQTLDISGTSVTGKNLACLQRLKHLVSLKMKGLLLKDEHLKALIPLKLVWLELANTDITDTGLHYVSQIKTLRQVDLEKCMNITEKGMDDLEKHLPNCHADHKDESMLLMGE
jgi:hypothetical protein